MTEASHAASDGESKKAKASVLLFVQQIEMPIPSALLDDPSHSLYLVTLICDAPELGLISCSSLSQSIVRPAGFVKSQSSWNLWESSQRIRILETCIGDLLEEFVAKVQHFREMNVK